MTWQVSRQLMTFQFQSNKMHGKGELISIQLPITINVRQLPDFAKN
jgi:hypothetical protein